MQSSYQPVVAVNNRTSHIKIYVSKSSEMKGKNAENKSSREVNVLLLKFTIDYIFVTFNNLCASRYFCRSVCARLRALHTIRKPHYKLL